jgi:hypothetical protein
VAIRSAGNHTFVYRQMVIGPVGGMRPSDGDLVRVVDRDHLPVGFGLWNSRSQITLRILAPGLSPPGAAFWEGRIRRAIELRREWKLGNASAPNLVQLIERHGVGVFSLVEDCRELDAFSCWLRGHPYAFLNTIKTAEHGRFDAAHELGHLVLHCEKAAHLGHDFEQEANDLLDRARTIGDSYGVNVTGSSGPR